MKQNGWEVVSKYTQEEAMSDGILMKNPRQDVFKECDVLTTNLFNAITNLAFFRADKRVFAQMPEELLGCLLLYAKDIYDNKKFNRDNDRDLFIIPKGDESFEVWFVRNENGKLTAMLPEDY